MQGCGINKVSTGGKRRYESVLDASHLRLPQDAAVLLECEYFPLLLEHLSGAFENHLETLFARLCVLLEAVDSELLNAVLDFLPPSAESCDLGSLSEVGLVGRRR